MWLVDGEMKVLFDYKEEDQPVQLVSGSIDLVINKHLIQEYLDTMEHIPHIKKSFSLEPTSGLDVNDY